MACGEHVSLLCIAGPAGSGWEEGLETVDFASAPEWLASTGWSLDRDFFHGSQLMYCA